MERIDLHQHLWTAPLVERLTARDALPLIRHSHGLTVLHCEGEQPWLIDMAAEAPQQRAALLRADRLTGAVIALSSPIGIEALPRACARELIDAHLDGVSALPEGFRAWGPLALDRADPDDVDDLLARGCVGISLVAGALASPDRVLGLVPVLERVQAWGVPLFVHPGRAPGQLGSEASFGEPLWWRSMTDYVAQMQASWLAFQTVGRRELPELVVIFAMLAGGAPLLAERLGARGGPQLDLRDPLTFYETSSYGPAAVEGMSRRVGSEQLVYGSDRPVVEPTVTGREALLQANAAALLSAVGAAR